ncbi:hypothetical protein HY641_00995 [Candidatus Woesearchaeota archaeon]|nr:hypothetical protein [Candidatus Woesearchaeota archaeon]
MSGAGPIGILQAMFLVEKGLEVYVAARGLPPNRKSKIVSTIGAQYVSVATTPLKEIPNGFGLMDLIIEASDVWDSECESR